MSGGNGAHPLVIICGQQLWLLTAEDGWPSSSFTTNGLEEITFPWSYAYFEYFKRWQSQAFYLYSLFRTGKERKGDNNLSDSDGLSFKHTYNREVLIDFPPEQRTRQLVNHYGQEKPSERANRLPTRSKKKHDVRNKGYDEEGPAKMLNVGRVTVTAPTRV